VRLATEVAGARLCDGPSMAGDASWERQPALAQLLDLSGRGAIVTGAAMGIGLGIARRLHEAGAGVLIADVDEQAARGVASELEGARPGSALAVRADVSDPEDVRRLVRSTVEGFGTVDILVNNAGIYPVAPMLQMELATFRRVLDVNLTGLFLCTQEAAARMIEQGSGGRIVNITSIDALHPSMVGLAHYDASKHGAWGFTKNVARELAPHGILVNAVAPGGIETPGTGEVDEESMKAFEAMIPMGRMGDADDIARTVLFLSSQLSSYMTGAQIVVDGGRLLM
jgi:2-dehydro-3-deoxy-D-gluconate 5-dehydrogenase